METIKDRIVLVTGATDGIGKQTAIDLAEIGAKVIIHGRDEEKAGETLAEIRDKSGNNSLESCVADFASLEQVREMAGDITSRFDRLDILINNAGVFMKNRKESHDGFEMTFAVNHLAHFLLTGMLLDTIKKPDYARIIHVASQAHASRLDFDNLQGEKFYDGYDAYARSKLCNILFSNKLARELAGTDVTSNALHPGVIRTKLLKAGFGYGGADWEQGSKTSVYLAASPDVEEITGRYFAHERTSTPAGIASDISVQDKLWKMSEEMTGFTFGF